MDESIKPTQNFTYEKPVLLYYHILEDPKMILEAKTLNPGKRRKRNRINICYTFHALLVAFPNAILVLKAPQVSTEQNYYCDEN